MEDEDNVDQQVETEVIVIGVPKDDYSDYPCKRQSIEVSIEDAEEREDVELQRSTAHILARDGKCAELVKLLQEARLSDAQRRQQQLVNLDQKRLQMSSNNTKGSNTSDRPRTSSFAQRPQPDKERPAAFSIGQRGGEKDGEEARFDPLDVVVMPMPVPDNIAPSPPPLAASQTENNGYSNEENENSDEQRCDDEQVGTVGDDDSQPSLWEILTSCDAHGATPLHLASAFGRVDTVKVLLRAEKEELEIAEECAFRGIPYQWRTATDGAKMNSLPKQLLVGASRTLDNYDHTPINLAAAEGHAEVVKASLSSGTKLLNSLRQKSSALHLAAFEGHAECVRLLLLNGANPEERDSQGCTALSWAEQKGSDETRLLLRAVLNDNTIARASSPNDAESKNKVSFYNSCAIGNIQEARRCMACPVKWSFPQRWTPLHVAAFYGHAEVCKLLVDNGFDLDARNQDGRSPLHEAVFEGHMVVTRVLLKAGASLRLRDTVGTTPIREGLRRGFGPELREIITELGIEASDDPLMDTELRELLTDKAVARKAKRNVAFPQKRMKGTMCSCQCHPFPGRESIVRQLEGGVRALDFPFVCDNEYSRFVSNSKGTQASALVKGAVQRSLSQDGILSSEMASNLQSLLSADGIARSNRASAPAASAAASAAITLTGPLAVTHSENPASAELAPWLRVVSRWCGENPNHSPLLVYLCARSPVASTIGDLNQLIPKLFGSSLFTPKHLKEHCRDQASSLGAYPARALYWGVDETCASLLSPVHVSWPSADSMRGRTMVILSGDKHAREMYRCARGVNPSTSVTTKGYVLMAHQLRDEVWVWVGRFRQSALSSSLPSSTTSSVEDGCTSEVEWDHCSWAGRGRFPHISANAEGDVVVAYESLSSSSSTGLSSSSSTVSTTNAPSASSTTRSSSDSVSTSFTDIHENLLDDEPNATSADYEGGGRVQYGSGCLVLSASGALPGGVAETCNQPLRLHWRARSVRVDKGASPAIRIFDNRWVLAVHLSETESRRTRLWYRVGELSWERGTIKWAFRNTKQLDLSRFLSKGFVLHRIAISPLATSPSTSSSPRSSQSFTLSVLTGPFGAKEDGACGITIDVTGTFNKKGNEIEWDHPHPRGEPLPPGDGGAVSHRQTLQQNLSVCDDSLASSRVKSSTANDMEDANGADNAASLRDRYVSDTFSNSERHKQQRTGRKARLSVSELTTMSQDLLGERTVEIISVPSISSSSHTNINQNRLLCAACCGDMQSREWKPVRLSQVMFVEAASTQESLFSDPSVVFFGVPHAREPELVPRPELMRGRVLRSFGSVFTNAGRLPQHYVQSSVAMFPTVLATEGSIEERQFLRYCRFIGVEEDEYDVKDAIT